MRSVRGYSALLADLHVSVGATSSTIAARPAAAATSWPSRPSRARLGAGGLFPHLPKAMSLLTSKVAAEEDGEEDVEGKILKLVLDGGGTNITAKCPGPLRDRIILVEVVKRQHVFECGWGQWRPFQTSGQGCRQVRKSTWYTDIKAYMTLNV